MNETTPATDPNAIGARTSHEVSSNFAFLIDRQLSIAQAHQFAQQITGGEAGVQCVGFVPQLVRRGYYQSIDLPLLTEEAIREALSWWELWDNT